MKLRLHPILVPFFLLLFISGGFALYALIFMSLLIHEAGHIVAARASGMKVRICTILPYGGELQIPSRYLYGKKQQVMVAIGGPIATAILLFIGLIVPFPGNDQFVRIQLAILFLNLLPILPLDGGQALLALLESDANKYKVRSAFLIYSISILSVLILLLFIGWPKTVLAIALALFLLVQNISAFKFRKYERAYELLKRKQLTS
ncbi:hypothetical protein QTL97_14265 [Sporosarcina thermotolerans]|uniref:Peptidase M50 domain-containing protein n=1 Tax=Sporosarcina thermotolerans TaxID=633404 RepID=A0AAW9A9L0_9BACL|nr:site-2 protease family protein [Sporosarcina thermotolerans]MDW0118097.1 hypothetical protein [Sporosarcina thermotolerans]WHT47590.1 hypothetical protein QNH10_15770 [Sporosarcina thermotolerans]